MPAGRCLVVRPVAPGDVDGLAALYGSLDEEDRFRRFSTSFVPPRSFFEAAAARCVPNFEADLLVLNRRTPHVQVVTLWTQCACSTPCIRARGDLGRGG